MLEVCVHIIIFMSWISAIWSEYWKVTDPTDFPLSIFWRFVIELLVLWSGLYRDLSNELRTSLISWERELVNVLFFPLFLTTIFLYFFLSLSILQYLTSKTYLYISKLTYIAHIPCFLELFAFLPKGFLTFIISHPSKGIFLTSFLLIFQWFSILNLTSFFFFFF